MTFGVKSIAKKILSRSPYRISRSPPNRFDAIEACLNHLASRSFAPSLIIDGGANAGSFAQIAHRAFPAAAIHMVEPQPDCAPTLKKLAGRPGFFHHPVALTSQAGDVRMFVQEQDTGAHIVWKENEHEANFTAQGVTLDDLFVSKCASADRILLKLDLQGHEMIALRGAARLLPKVEVVLTEMSFFRQFHEPTVPELVDFFDAAGFDLYDIAALSARTRDGRLRQGDGVFVRRESALMRDGGWH